MAKIKIKSNKAVQKRFKLTANGKLKRFKANKQHILGYKSSKRKRNLRKATLVDSAFLKSYKKMCG